MTHAAKRENESSIPLKRKQSAAQRAVGGGSTPPFFFWALPFEIPHLTLPSLPLPATTTPLSRLCILKGIHPREPRKKPAGRHKTYYHVKDILFLAHEPLLNKFRADAAFERRVRKARAKKGDEAARALEAERPVHRLDHLIRERYPTFNDALRDLDDPLSLVHLFAALPSDQKAGVPPAAVAASKALATEWAAWCARSHSLRRAFISVKGYYFQASVRGNQVTWLAPHALAQVLPHDVDFRVMATFLELACTTLRHVLARLYADLGSSSPPRADAALDGAAAGLEALMRGLAAAAAVSSKDGNAALASASASASAPATPTLLLGSLNGKRERRRARRAAERAAAAENGEGGGGESSGGDDEDGDDDDAERGDAAKAARLAALPAKAAALAAEAGDGTMLLPFFIYFLLHFYISKTTPGGSDCLAFAGAVFPNQFLTRK